MSISYNIGSSFAFKVELHAVISQIK